MAAEDICGTSIKEEFRDFNAWNRKYQFAGNAILAYDAIVPVGIMKRISRFIIDTVLPKLAKNKLIMDLIFPFIYPKFLKILFGPLPGDEE